MKRLTFLLLLMAYTGITYADIVSNTDTNKSQNADTTKSKPTFVAVEHPPEYPGGVAAFNKHITQNLKYPDVARLIGVNGRIVLTFVIDRDGKVINVTPINCIGAGCESEAVKVLESLKPWSPGIASGKRVRVQYSAPISFSVPKGKVKLNTLRASNYGFIFQIKNKLYTIDEAEKIIGNSFMSDQVEIAEPFYNADNEAKFIMPDKKEVYVVKMNG